jgi:hypothetical protein
MFSSFVIKYNNKKNLPYLTKLGLKFQSSLLVIVKLSLNLDNLIILLNLLLSENFVHVGNYLCYIMITITHIFRNSLSNQLTNIYKMLDLSLINHTRIKHTEIVDFNFNKLESCLYRVFEIIILLEKNKHILN